MNNLYHDIRESPFFNKFEVGDSLFAEYTCPLESKKFEIWTELDYLVHVVSGKKTWHTTEGSWPVDSGKTLFFRKGGAIVEQHFETDFCVMIFFVPDYFAREVVSEHQRELARQPTASELNPCAIPVNHDLGLDVFFESMKSYFSGTEKPSEPLLRLKLKELIVSILLSTKNPELSSYFREVAAAEGPSLLQIMESNFRYRLSIEQFAQLCHRSLSTFKRDFQKHLGESPGRWVLQKRLDYAAALLRSSPHPNITEVVFESGFEDVSHFSKAFKNRFGKSPTVYRKENP